MRITLRNTTIKVRIAGKKVKITSGGPPVRIVFRQTRIKVSLQSRMTRVIRFGAPGLRGKPGEPGEQGVAGVGIPVTDIRHDRELVGVKNGVNLVFALPSGDKAINEVVGVKIEVFVNGVHKHEGPSDDFTVSESGGSGTGYDTISFVVLAPIPRDRVAVNYFLFS